MSRCYSACLYIYLFFIESKFRIKEACRWMKSKFWYITLSMRDIQYLVR